MYRNYQVVICIPSGRRHYLKILFRLLLKQQYPAIVDACHLWLNTTDEDNLRWIQYIERTQDAGHRWFQVIRAPSPPNAHKLWATVSKFYRYAQASNTINIKLDDDTVLVDNLENFKRLLDFRIEHPQYFLISANVLNNSICIHFLQKMRLLNTFPGISLNCHDKIGMSGAFAERLHRHLLFLKGDMSYFSFDGGVKVPDFCRICINCILWFGKDMEECARDVPEEDEIYLSSTIPSLLLRPVAIFGEFKVCHFSYSSQRVHLQAVPDILECYKKLAIAPDLEESWLEGRPGGQAFHRRDILTKQS